MRNFTQGARVRFDLAPITNGTIMKRDPALDQLQTLRDFIRLGASRLGAADLCFGHGTDNAWDEALLLVLHGAGLPWHADPQVLDARLLDTEKAAILELLRLRIEDRVPAPYLTGEAWFCDLPFHVDPHTLIPRSPIADLIREEFRPWLTRPVTRILDLCTGSGCIGIACAQVFAEARVDLADISTPALSICQRNIARHRLEDRVQALESDLFDALKGRYDLILCNPPYVDAEDFQAMPAEYRHEPATALASGSDGLDLTRRILHQAADWLEPEGLLVMEVGNSETALQEAYPQVPFVWVELPGGGNGVFVLDAETLAAHCHQF